MTRGITLAVLGAALLALSGVALSLGQPSTDSGERHTRIDDATPDLKSTLGVFARAQGGGEALSEELAAELEASDEARPGENPSQARRIDLPTGTVHLWPTADGVCSSWGACIPTRQIQEQGVVVGDAATGIGETYERLQMAGIVRDGIDTVTVTFADGRQAAVQVRENVFVLELTGVAASEIPERLSWKDGNGAHSRPTGIETPAVVAERFQRAYEKAQAKAAP